MAVLLGRWKFDEGTGTSAADSSGNGNALTLTSDAWDSSTPSTKFANPNCFAPDGSIVAAAASSSVVDMTTGSFSIALWIKRSRTTVEVFTAKTVGNIPSFPGYEFYLNSNAINCSFSGGGHSLTFAQSGTIDTNWHHVVIICDRGTPTNSKIYIDGTNATSGTPSNTLTGSDSVSTTNNFTIGSESDGDFKFSGGIDDVRVYGGILTAAEIATLASGGEIGHGMPLVGYSPLVGGTVLVGSGSLVG
jgi:hypothetical protein